MSQNQLVLKFLSEEFSVEYGNAVPRLSTPKKARVLQQPARERKSVPQSIIDLPTGHRLISQHADQEFQSQEYQFEDHFSQFHNFMVIHSNNPHSTILSTMNRFRTHSIVS